MTQESFIRKIITTGDATGITFPKNVVDYRGFTKGKIVKVTIELLDDARLVLSGSYAGLKVEKSSWLTVPAYNDWSRSPSRSPL